MSKSKTRRNILHSAIYLSIVVLLCLLVVVVSQTEWLSLSIQQGESSAFVENVQITIWSPSWSVEYFCEKTSNETVADLLFECAAYYHIALEKKYYKGYKSYLIEGINGITNGDDDRYWQYYVNGEFADVGCSNYFLDDHDVVEWRFEHSNWN
jgi:hypothetical protein